MTERWTLVVTTAGEIVGYVAGNNRILRGVRMDAREVAVVPERRALDAEAEVERLTRINAEDRAARRREVEALRAEREGLLAALRAIEGPCDELPWILPYREAGGGYEGLQAIASAALSAVQVETKYGWAHADDRSECMEPAWCRREHVRSAVRAETEGE